MQSIRANAQSRAGLALLALLLIALPGLASPIRQSNLDNGLEILLKEAQGGPMVASIVTVGAGARYEDENSYGASHFLEHMCFNGTATRSREEINEGIKAFGGYINAFTRREYTCYILLIPGEYLREGLAIQADMLFGSLLSEAEFEKEKRVVLEEMNKDYDSGSYRGELHRNAHVLDGTPYAHPILGTPATIENLDRDEVLAYYKQRYQPANCRLFLVGDFKRREARQLLDEIYGSHDGQPSPPPATVRPSWPDTPEFHVYRAEEGEPRMDLYWLAPSIADGDYPAQLALTQMLSDAHRSPLAGDSDLEISAGVELFADFNLFSVTITGEDLEPGALKERVAGALADLAEWVPDPEWTAEVAHGLRVEEVFLQDTFHYYAMMKSAELHLGGFPLLASYTRSLAELSAARVRKALERGILAGPPRLIWSAQEADSDALAAGLAPEAFRPGAKTMELAAATTSRRRGRPRQSGGRPQGKGEERLMLANGLTVLLRSDPSSEVCATHLLVRGRSAAEPEGREGMVTLAHRLLESGTAEVDEATVAAALSRMGAKLKTVDNPWIPFDNYYTREDFSFLRLESLDESAAEAMALLAELVGGAAYPDAAVEREKGRMLSSLGMNSPRPSAVAEDALNVHIYDGGPRGRSVGGTTSSIGAISSQDLRDFHPGYFHPRRMILSVVSGLPLGDLRSIVRDSFGELICTAEPVSLPETRLNADPIEIRKPMDKSQVALIAARITESPATAAPELQVLVDVLSARMALELREKQGLAYSLGAGLRDIPGLATGEDGFGLLSLRIATATENREQARQGLVAELERMAGEPPREEEVFRAVNGRWGRQLMRDLSRIHQAYRMGLAEHLGADPFSGPSTIVDAQRNADSERLGELARQILLQDDWSWVLAGGGLD